MHIEVELNEDLLEVHLEIEEGDEVQPEAEGVDEDHPSSPIIMMVGALESPPLGEGHTFVASAAPRSCSSIRHYAQLKSTKATQSLIGFPACGKQSCNNHLFFEGLHPLSMNARPF